MKEQATDFPQVCSSAEMVNVGNAKTSEKKLFQVYLLQMPSTKIVDCNF